MPKHYILFQSDPGGGDGGGTGDPDPTPGGGDGDPEPQAGNGDPPGGDPKDQMVPAKEAQEARQEAKNLRTRLKKAEARAEELEKAQLSDQEKLEKERDTLRTNSSKLEEDNKKLRVQVVAGRIGIVDPEAASALLDWDKIEDPEDSASIEKALREMAKEKTYLMGNVPGGSDGGAGGGSGSGGKGMNELLREAAGKA